MKYLSESMTMEETKKTYYALARKLHPDVGGDEEEFKLLADEFSALTKRSFAPVLEGIDDLMAKAGAMVNIITDTIRELYPKTRVVLNYTFDVIEAEIHGNVPMHKMLHIEEIIKSFQYPFRVYMQFKRGDGKKWYTFYTEGMQTYCNMARDERSDLSDAKVIHEGTRYTIRQGKKYAYCFDSKEKKVIHMRRTPKFTLKELLGL